MANEPNSALSKLKQYFWLFITVIVLLVYWMFKSVDFSTTTETKQVIVNTTQVDSLRKVIASQQDELEQYDANTQALCDSIAILKTLVRKNNQSSNQINTKTNEKANNTVVLNSNELFQFLADRYKDSIRFQR